MPKYGLLINYEFCVGCHVCELACKQEHNRPDGEWGIYVKEVKPEMKHTSIFAIKVYVIYKSVTLVGRHKTIVGC